MSADFEKLGALYLGKKYDLARAARTDELILYDSRDLVTHAVCVGMTGSGKTGLCMALLEEAAMDGVPAVVIDPKGDLGNLMLTFPALKASDFLPWINADDARRNGLEPQAYAEQQALRWREGLAHWGQHGDRISRLRDAVEFAIYTPGSSAGIPVSVLKSFAAPPPAIREDAELLSERISTTATSLLTLAGVPADPVTGREHLLIATLLGHAWRAGADLDLADLIRGIQTPPVTRVGVMELESFYPAGERFELAMKLNALAASPGFARWMEGQPLDINALLHTPGGKPRVAIFSIAHLGDAERMFFVALLLNQTLSWARSQSGTSSLRAILYMDEIAGYCPPTANPPSKAPLLTLMKQARAFGLGVVLATQNPVDLDYKGLSNAGTWFIGRLQTERDKARVLDGLEGAAAGVSARFDRADLDKAISQLGNRVFLMNNVHEDAPVIFEVRWVMSYLRGPLTRDQIRTLMRERPAAPPAETAGDRGVSHPAASLERVGTAAAAKEQTDTHPPVLPPGITQRFLPVRSPRAETITYRPMLMGSVRIFYTDSKRQIEHEQSATYLVSPGLAGEVEWDAAALTELTSGDIETEPAPGARFARLPAAAGRPASYSTWQKQLAGHVYRTGRLELLHASDLKLTAIPDESQRDFRARLALAAREARDASIEKLRERYAPRLAALQERIRRAEQTLAVQQEQARQAKVSTVISMGTAVLSALLGRRLGSAGNIGRAGTAVRGVGRSMREAGDVGRAGENIATLQAQLAEMDAEFQKEVYETSVKSDPASLPLETISIRPKKANITVDALVLAWAPYATSDGKELSAWC